MQAQSKEPIKTFTIGVAESRYDEAAHAAAVARHLGTDHTELYVTPREAMEVIPKLPLIYDEPFADSSQIPTLLVSQLARRSVKVALSGDGGDELFGGYNRYAFGSGFGTKLSRMPAALRNAGARLINSLPPSTWNVATEPLMRFAPSRYRVNLPGDKLYKLADALTQSEPDQQYHNLVSHWKSPEQIVLSGQEPVTALSGLADVAIADPAARMMLFDLLTYLPDDILVKLDRAAMSVSLETRAPLLDHRVVEFAWKVPMAEKINANGTKQILRSVLRRYVPATLIDRPKMGFAIPIDSWLRSPLRDWAESLLDPARLRREGYLVAEPIQKLWRQHLDGRYHWHSQLWGVLMFQAWLESVDGR